jgi:hypothetical protein
MNNIFTKILKNSNFFFRNIIIKNAEIGFNISWNLLTDIVAFFEDTIVGRRIIEFSVWVCIQHYVQGLVRNGSIL